MAAVRCDDTVLRSYRRLKAHRDRFLERILNSVNSVRTCDASSSHAHLPNGKMTEPSNKFSLVKCIGSHLHSPHSIHLRVPLDKALLGHFDVELGFVAFEGLK